MYEQSGDWGRALELSADNELLAARCREKLGQWRQAAELYKKCGAFPEAAFCLEKANDYTAAADLHLKSRSFPQAAHCLAKIDRRLDAAKLYVVSGQIASAYELVAGGGQSTGKTKESESFKALLEWCLETGKTAEAAQLLELKKDYLAASEKYRECMMLKKAAGCLEKLGRSAEAGVLHRQSGEMERAADCFKQAKQWREAGSCLEKLQKWAEAKNMYQRCHDQEGVARCNNALNWL
jgi:tetratricopeptide (TPR) repeat protein